MGRNNIEEFRFKHFGVSHSRSAMKVGVDGVLLGAWCSVGKGARALDVGTGCGVIALMLAQRGVEHIVGIDIDYSSVEEATLNFRRSAWASSLEALNEDFIAYCTKCGSEGIKFDVVVSNPPYFDSGVDYTQSRRMSARHDGALSPLVIINNAKSLLYPGGIISMILPSEREKEIVDRIEANGLALRRIHYVSGHANAPVKRILIECGEKVCTAETGHLILEESPGVPTEAYRAICKDFYLKF